MFPTVGYGSLIMDIYYENGVYQGCDGGGSVFNLLSNLALQGLEAHAICSGGLDKAAEICVNSLNHLHVSTDTSYLVKNFSTRRLHVDIHKKEHSATGQYEFYFTKKCFSCGRAAAWMSFAVPQTFPESLKSHDKGFVVFDLFVNPQKVKIAEVAREQGWRSCADLGHTGPLVYFTPRQILKMFNAIDILQLNGRVAKFIVDKFAAKSFADVYNQMSNKVVIVTKGAEGAIFYSRDSFGDVKEFTYKPALVSGVVDTSGAGDAFFSGVLSAYREHYTENTLEVNFFDKAFDKGFEMSKKAILTLGARGHLGEDRLVKIDFAKSASAVCSTCGLG